MRKASPNIIGSATKRSSEMIPYGAEIGAVETRLCSTAGAGAAQYFLYVSRMEPENNALLVREAFERCGRP